MRSESERQVYGSKRWRKLRAWQLSVFPLCCYCEQIGCITPATVVDHVIPHRGDDALLWDPQNLQSLCTEHHDSAASVKDKHGFVPGCGLDGEPLDPSHPWAQGGHAWR